MKRDSMKTIEAIKDSLLTNLDYVKDTANSAEQDVMHVMKDFVYSLNKEQRRNDRIRKFHYFAIGIGTTATILGLAGFLLMSKKNSLEVKKMRKNVEQTLDQLGQKIEDSGRYLKYKTEETAAHISNKTEDAVDSLKENAADTAETISKKSEHAVNTLKENVEKFADHSADAKADFQDKVEDFTDDVKNTAKQVKRDWEKAIQKPNN